MQDPADDAVLQKQRRSAPDRIGPGFEPAALLPKIDGLSRQAGCEQGDQGRQGAKKIAQRYGDQTQVKERRNESVANNSERGADDDVECGRSAIVLLIAAAMLSLSRGNSRSADAVRISCRRLEQAVADEFAFGGAARTGEMAAARIGDELIHHAEARHFLENPDEAAAQVALAAEEISPASNSMPWRQGGQRPDRVPSLGGLGQHIGVVLDVIETAAVRRHGEAEQVAVARGRLRLVGIDPLRGQLLA